MEQLDRGATAKREATLRGSRTSSLPRIPQHIDVMGPLWSAPPPKDEARLHVSKDCGRHFKNNTKNFGDAFSEPEYLKPKVLDYWTASRVVVPDRTFKYPDVAPPRFRIQSEAFQEHNELLRGVEPKNSGCGRLHQEWLEKFAATRDRELNPEFFAFKRIKRAEKAIEMHQQRRQLTRDILSRPQNGPQLSENVKVTLNKVKRAVQVSHRMQQAAGICLTKGDERRDEERLARAKSAPALRIRPPTPEKRVRHLNEWQGPDHPLRLLRSSTPWREYDEELKLKKLARRAAAKPKFGATC